MMSSGVWGNGPIVHIDCVFIVMRQLTPLQPILSLAQSIDACYWECCNEASHEGASAPAPKQNSSKGSDNLTSGKTQNPVNKSLTSALQNKSTSTSSMNSVQQKKTPDLQDKLSKDGKLTPQECQDASTTSFASSVERLAIWPRIVQRPHQVP